jgi:uncharacterized membrane protein YedE/YeeE
MSAPFSEAFGSDAALWVALAIGIAFGFTLERAGMGNAKKLVGQFYLTDMTVFKVMFSAILTAMLGVFWLSRLGVLDVSRIYVPETWLLPQLVGGLVFGVGFAAAGLCPGTSCVSAATGRVDGMAAVVGMFAGVLLTGALFSRFEAFYDRTPRGALTLPTALSMPAGIVVLGVVMLALGGFQVAEWLERRAATLANQ